METWEGLSRSPSGKLALQREAAELGFGALAPLPPGSYRGETLGTCG
ncbi:hypothetical protein MPNT_10258 [Candidatus Methylacidithermus pantelleriae]|uniref:Uncharacterized protein n=1 Tax=Candidatus Methylacidithermus pantelleriae TaxID=2744239 RepID=A0A8J2FRN1_9BACT|nr:hypothetical protein MPNT_10258 [Candidatus Methylacidithermus pantelleriae]